MDPGRKIAREFENPIDNFYIDLTEHVKPVCYAHGITPNMVTAVSLAVGLLGCAFILLDARLFAVLCIQAAYFLDCLDGNLARTYNQETDFGDIFDHVCDMIKIYFTFICIIYSIKSSLNLILFFGLSAVLGLLMLFHFGCQEKLSGFSKHNKSLAVLKKIPHTSADHLKFSKYFGSGTFINFVCLYIIFSK